MLVDTDVLVWYMRGNLLARKRIDCLGSDIILSAVTQMELIQGMRNKAELLALEKAITHWQAKLAPITQTISDHAVKLVRLYSLSHAMKMGEALIAATALTLNEELLTANDKHYRMIDGLSVERFRPD